jgi:hypothetical protein
MPVAEKSTDGLLCNILHDFIMSKHEPPDAHDDLTIYVNGTEHQLLKKIAGKDQLLKLVDLDPLENDIFVLDEHGRKIAIENTEGIQLQGGMRFLTQHR